MTQPKAVYKKYHFKYKDTDHLQIKNLKKTDKTIN